MQLLTYASAAAAIVSTASATANRADLSAPVLMKSCDTSKPLARVINRCDYPVYLWSVLKGQGCPSSGMVTLKKGETYQENYAYANDTGGTGVSIKISRTQQCKGNDITQLEYFLENRKGKEQWWNNYLDVSYVDCEKDCPTKQEGYYLVAGDQKGANVASAGNTFCPILSCTDAASCAKMSYILPDDVQTKVCGLTQSMDFYMCGGQPPSADDVNPGPAKSPEAPKQPATPSKAPSSAANYKANAAAVTPAPEIKEPKPLKIKTAVVTVTEYQYVNAKRHDHAHAHARRHQQFHA